MRRIFVLAGCILIALTVLAAPAKAAPSGSHCAASGALRSDLSELMLPEPADLATVCGNCGDSACTGFQPGTFCVTAEEIVGSCLVRWAGKPLMCSVGYKCACV